MAIPRASYNLKEFCNVIGVPYELLVSVRDNQDFVRNKLAELVTGKSILETINEFIQEQEYRVLNGEYKERTKQNYCDFLMPFRRFIAEHYPDDDILTLDKKKLNHYLKQCKVLKKNEDGEKTHVSPYTKNAYIKYVRGLLYFALQKGYFYHKNDKEYIKDKFQYVPTERLPRYVPDDVISVVLDQSRKTRDAYRNHAIICFLIGTGARVDEITKVKISDIDFINKSVKLTGKYGRTRYVNLYPFLEKLLISYLDLKKITDLKSKQFLFTTFFRGVDKQMHKSSVQRMIYNIFKKIGRPNDFSTHCFRHTYAVNCLKAGMKIEIIAELLGHKSIETTMIYTKLLPNDLIKEAQKYPIHLEKVLFTLLGMENVDNETDDK